MSDQKLKIAVFIDFDNIEIGVKTTLNVAFDVGAVLEAIKERGEVITKVAYGDWKRSGDHGRAMAQHAVRMVQRVIAVRQRATYTGRAGASRRMTSSRRPVLLSCLVRYFDR